MLFKDLKKVFPKETFEMFRNMVRNMAGFSGIDIEVVNIDENKKEMVVSIQQTTKLTDHIYTNKEMHDLVRPFIDMVSKDGWKAHLRPIKFFADELGNVSASWVKDQMEENEVSQRQLARDLGVDEFVISKLLSNKIGFTRWHKAAFFYYFKK